MPIYDWETLAVAQKYIEEANRTKMAARHASDCSTDPRG
jgi:hypothetical protein